MTEPTGTADRRRFLVPAISYPQYRFLWFSALGTYIGRWIETVVVAWLVLEMTDSPVLVGLLGTCRFAAMLLGPFCGAISDRFSRRAILLAVQVVYGASSLAILTLFATSRIEVWHLFVFTLIGGVCYTFDYSTRYAVAADIVRSPDITSAASLLQVATGFTSILGPLLGGSLLEVIGASGCFTLISGSFLLSLLALLPLSVETKGRTGNGSSIWQNLASGLRYIKKDRVLFSLILIAALVNLFVFPYQYTLMPIFARDVLGTGSGGLGQLMAAAGLGAIIGSLSAGMLPRCVNKGKLLIIAVVAWPAAFIILPYVGSFYLSVVVLITSGIAQGMTMVLIHALLLTRSSEEMRGRVLGTRTLAISTLSVGNLITGYGAGLWGAPLEFVLNSSVFILVTALVVIRAPELLRQK